MKQATPQSLCSLSSKMNLSYKLQKSAPSLLGKELNSLPFNYRSEVIMKDIILVISVLKNSFGQFLSASWEGFKMLGGMTSYQHLNSWCAS